MAQKKESESLEAMLEELETIIEQMETGKLSLDESLKRFERGVSLTKHCQQILRDAEQKVQILMNDKHLKKFKPTDE